MTKAISYLFLMCSLLTLVACGSNDDDDNSPIAQQEERIEDFSTRLNNNLLIAGTRCNGGETTSYGGQTYTCERDEWLITIDDVNTCDANGGCTEVGVPAIVADLDDTDLVSIPEYLFYEIDPESPVSASQRETLNDVYVRFNLNGDTEVVFR